MCITHILTGIETFKLQAFMRENVTTIFLSVFALFNVSILLSTCNDNDGSIEQLNGIICYSY